VAEGPAGVADGAAGVAVDPGVEAVWEGLDVGGTVPPHAIARSATAASMTNEDADERSCFNGFPLGVLENDEGRLYLRSLGLPGYGHL
jgi:hypothetical protein